MISIPTPDPLLQRLRAAHPEMWGGTTKKMKTSASGQAIRSQGHSGAKRRARLRLVDLPPMRRLENPANSPDDTPDIYIRSDRPVEPMAIVKAVALAWRVPMSCILSTRRSREYLGARRHAIALLHEHTSLSYPAIGRVIGGRDHSTIMHSLKVFGGMR